MAPTDPPTAHLSYLKSVLDCTNDALFVTEQDPNGPMGSRICFVNDAFSRLTGYSLHDATGMPPTFLCAEYNNPSVIDQVGVAFEQREKATFMLLNSRKDGSRFRAELFINPLFDNGGSGHVVAIQRVHPDNAVDDAGADAVEGRFQSLADNLNEAILIYRDGQPLFANHAYVELFGYSTMAEALREISPLMNLPFADGQPPPGHAQPVHCEALRTDGLPLQLAICSHVIDWRGGPAVMLTIDREKPARHPAPRPAASSPARSVPAAASASRPKSDDSLLLRELMDSVPVILAHKTRDLRYSYVNKTYADWVGMPRDQIVGHHVCAVRNEAHYQLMKSRRAAVLAGHTVHYTTQCEFPGRGLCDLRTTLIPQRNTAGEVEGYFSLVQDITDLKDIERMLRQREQQLRVIIDSVPALISYRDRNLRYQYVNRQYHEWYGVRREDMIGRHMTEFVDLDRFRILKPYIDRVLAGEHVRHTQSVDFPSVGKRTVHINFIPHKDEHGHVVGFFSLSQELTLGDEKKPLAGRRLDHRVVENTADSIGGE
ncbi:MAG: PAS domain-containing protein [Alphaproteobacteria bacterium]